MNFYVILGVRREASAEELKRAFRRLARKYHPDINPGDRAAAELFRQVSEAYDTLSDPDRRRRYDAGGESSAQIVETSFEFTGFDFSRAAEESRASTFGDLFADLLPGASQRLGPPERGADLHTSLSVPFEDSITGARRAVTITRLERCGACGGRGAIGGPIVACEVCEGAGQVRGARGHMVFSRPCPRCSGSGRVSSRVCPGCGGEGLGVRSETVAVEVPPGASDGQIVSLAGQGHAGRRGGPPGDLHVSLQCQPHRFFKRVGDDLHVEVPVAIHEAALGSRIDVPSVEGAARLRVPPGTQSGQTFRLRERGAPGRDGRRGDLVVSVRIVLPAVLDERSKALLSEFAALHPEDVRRDLGM